MDDVYWVEFVNSNKRILKHKNSRGAAIAAFQFRDEDLENAKKTLEDERDEKVTSKQEGACRDEKYFPKKETRRQDRA